MRGQQLGSMIAAVFGLIYVLVNTGPLPTGVALPLRVLAGIGFLAVLVSAYRPRTAGTPAPEGTGFGRAYWLVVAAEVIALFAGLAVVNGPLDAPQAGVAWVSTVVGVHFFALAVVFRDRFFHGLGAAVTLCGLVGLVLAATGTGEAPIAVISGVVPGALLLASGWWGTRRSPVHKAAER